MVPHIVRDPVGEHVEEAVVRLWAVVDYLSDRFADQPAKSSCTTEIRGSRQSGLYPVGRARARALAG